jgi:biotin synthase
MDSTRLKSDCSLRYNWTLEQALQIYNQPFPELIFQAQSLHRKYFDPCKIQRSTLLSIKTGGCPENCSYCPQSAHHDTGLEKHKLLPLSEVLEKANQAKQKGATRFCMGAAWREVKDGAEFDQILKTVTAVAHTGMEVCCTLGMLRYDQAVKLKEAGCYAYNHNLDTSPEFYSSIISTRVYQDRLETLENVRAANITICCGGIIGMGESVKDRLTLLLQLACQNPHPESVPINLLIKIEGTPLAYLEDVNPLEYVKVVATAKILMPSSMVRLSAGRTNMSDETQALCFLAGANSIFTGDKLLTATNPREDDDEVLINRLGMSWFSLEDSNAEKTISEVSDSSVSNL